MESKLLQTLRYRLQSRMRRLNSTDWMLYHWQLCQYWGFLKSHEIFTGILNQLEQKSIDYLETNEEFKIDITSLIDGTMKIGTIMTFNTEKEQVLASYLVVKSCVEHEVQNLQAQKEINIGKRYTSENGYSDIVNIFTEIFVYPLYEYIDEQLDSENILLYLLIRYKHVCEWFKKEKLYNLWKSETQKGEKTLAFDLYEFLYSQGLEFHIEPSSPTGEIDLISEQVGDERLLIDAKVFKGDRSYIIKGVNQVYTYTLTYNQPFGCLVIFDVSDNQLCFTSSRGNDPNIATFAINNKLLFIITIDIVSRPSASKRGKLNTIIISENDLMNVCKK